VPAAAGVKLPDEYVPPPATVTVVVNAAVGAQLASSGPNTAKVMVPLGLKPPVRVAVALMVLPRVVASEALTEMAVAALVTTTLSLRAPQPLATPSLFPSPEYEAVQR
jgi:hypothetical protein